MNATSRIPSHLLAAVGFAAMACAGWKLAGTSSGDAVGSVATDVTAAHAATKSSRSVRESGPPPQVRRQLAAIRSAGSPKERMRATIALAYSLPVDELGEWLDKRWFQSEPGFDLTLFNKIANQRWRTEDPQGRLKHAMDSGGGGATEAVAAWAKQDPAAALAWFKDNPNPQLEMGCLTEIAKSDPALALGHLRDIFAGGGGDQSGNYYLNNLLREVIAKSPAALAAAMDSFPTKLRQQADAMLVAQRLKADPDAEIRALMLRPDGLQALQRSANEAGRDLKIGDRILADLASLPDSWRNRLPELAGSLMTAQNAEKWFRTDFAAAGLTEQQGKQLQTSALRQLMYQKPEQMLKLMGEIDFDEDARKTLIQNLFGYGRKPEQNEQLLALLASDEDRALANQFMERNGLNGNGPQVTAATPAEWLDQAATYDVKKSGSAYINILAQWDKAKLEELATGFKNLPADKKLGAARLLAGTGNHNDAGFDPALKGQAIGYLATLPQEKPQEGQEEADPFGNNRQLDPANLASSHAVHWGVKDADAASQWVQTLPEGKAKLWAQKNLAANWVQYDPDAAKQWIGSLPAAARTEVEKFMKNPDQ
ncbi:hypothetical protein [Luteolibacter sp. Populi]|uniref:hypothetical protein n=1 Tax=Luteolibacter sp. Populi TaxID=3230487 RepID=UPI0034679A88